MKKIKAPSNISPARRAPIRRLDARELATVGGGLETAQEEVSSSEPGFQKPEGQFGF